MNRGRFADVLSQRQERTRRLVRESEFLSVRDLILPAMRVLDLGAGDGLQSRLIEDCGATAIGIEVSGSQGRRWAGHHRRHVVYDGFHIPFREDSFDMVFASNVLLHVDDMPKVLDECRRVTRPGSKSIYINPTPSWRLWTSLLHPIGGALRLASGGSLAPRQDRIRQEGPARAKRAKRRLLSWVRPSPLGSSRSAWQELFEFHPKRWVAQFEAAQYSVLDVRSLGVFYTGQGLVPEMGRGLRQRLAHVLGSGCKAYVVKDVGNTLELS